MVIKIRLCLLIISVHIFSGCTPVKKQDDSHKFIAAYVPPYYYFMGPVINVGEFSQGLVGDEKTLNTVIHLMESNKEKLTPEQMYVAAIRLYETGNRELSVLWFYRAFYRSRLYSTLVDESGLGSEKILSLKNAYSDFHRQVGPFINGYAGCNTEQWVDYIKRVERENVDVPDMTLIFGEDVKFIPKNKWDEYNKDVSKSMVKLIESIESLKPSWNKIRDSNGLNDQFCG